MIIYHTPTIINSKTIGVDMPFFVPNSIQPPTNALVVCAGTVTCKKVSSMGAGFGLFKALFNENTSANFTKGGWQKDLQNVLDAYHSKQSPIPPYQRIAQQNGLVGGVATVAAFSSAKGVTFDTYATDIERQEGYKEQYKQAIKHAMADAKQLERPLFIQPLGIGEYGWDPKLAANLFAEIIVQLDPDDNLDITIPIFNQKKGSKDLLFKEALITRMAEFGRAPGGKVTNLAAKDPNLDNKQVILAIVNTLISNIENKSNGRWTSGEHSKKIDLLKGIQEALTKESEEITFANGMQEHYLQKIMDVCLIKRNSIHFWATPTSVGEYTQLLHENGLELPVRGAAEPRPN